MSKPTTWRYDANGVALPVAGPVGEQTSASHPDLPFAMSASGLAAGTLPVSMHSPNLRT